MTTITLTPGAITLSEIRNIASGNDRVALAPGWRGFVERGVEVIRRKLDAGEIVYGVNTGFGRLANRRIPPAQTKELQYALIRSHAAGTGELLPRGVVRMILALKAASLARGFSGVRPVVIERLMDFINLDVLPCIPGQGSVGASGDLAPLAHLSMPLLGEGEVHFHGSRMPAQDALAATGLEPLALGPKEGLALLNGTQVSTALALDGLFRAEDLLLASVLVGAMSVDAASGSVVPFDARIHEVRGHSGQASIAAAFRGLLAGSELTASQGAGSRVQDPYSLRCQPQVLGACLTQLRHAADDLEVESNAVSDNPLVFADTGDVLSGGNFHAEQVAMTADAIAIVLAEIGALAERRIALLVDSSLSGLPPFLVENSGLNSGFMLAHVTAAALASENKSYAHPASVDSLPTSANQEDHVSMATFAGRRLGPMTNNTQGVLAIGLLCAAQGIDLRRPLQPSGRVVAAQALLRKRVGFWGRDRYLAPDIAAARELVTAPEMLAILPGGVFASRAGCAGSGLAGGQT